MNPTFILITLVVLVLLGVLMYNYLEYGKLVVKPEERKQDILPGNYFKGYRRIAMEPEKELVEGDCHSCRHAVAYVTWHCDRRNEGCKWEPAYRWSEMSFSDKLSSWTLDRKYALPVNDYLYIGGERDVNNERTSSS